MPKLTLFCILLCLCVGCDQSTKYTARHFLEGQPALNCMGDLFRLSYVENKGAFLSAGAHMTENARNGIFIVAVSIFIAAFSAYVICNIKKFNGLSVSSSALIIGGGLGNWIDRCINQGAVIDFINFGIGSARTGIFNVADIAIMVGVFVFARFHMCPKHPAPPP